MSHRLEALLEPLRHSPLKSEVAGILSRELQAEMEKRAKFYREMTPSEKVEFIDGEVVMHSPAKIKFEDYAAHGVGEYWIVDPETCVIEQYLLCGENYQLECKTSNGEITCRTILGLIVPVKACFEAAENLRAVQAMVSPSS
jgi:hypothetical protein